MDPKELLKRSNVDELIQLTPETNAAQADEIFPLSDERMQKRPTSDPFEAQFADVDIIDKLQGPYRNRRTVYGAWLFLVAPCVMYGSMMLVFTWWDPKAGAWRPEDSTEIVVLRVLYSLLVLAMIGFWPYIMSRSRRRVVASAR